MPDGVPSRAEISEYKRLMCDYDRMKEQGDPKQREAFALMTAHPLHQSGTIAPSKRPLNSGLARREIEAACHGLPYWGEPRLAQRPIERGWIVTVTYPKPIPVSAGEDVGAQAFECYNERSVRKVRRDARRRWHRWCERMVREGLYDEWIGWTSG